MRTSPPVLGPNLITSLGSLTHRKDISDLLVFRIEFQLRAGDVA